MMRKIFKSKFVLGVLTTLIFTLSFWTISNRVSAVSVDAYESLKIFTDVVNIVEESYTDDVETREIVYSAVKGLLRGLDPHSSFLTPEEYKEMQVDTKGSFGGIGIEIGLRNDILTIISPIEDTPAFRAGLKAKDRIVKIEEKSTKDMGLMEAVKLMRGKKGTELNISVMRKGFDEPRVFTLVRDVIKIKSVKFRELEEGYGYVRITQFQSKTGHDLEKALRELEGKGKDKELKGLVLDLRNNPGGLLQQAVVVADKFLSEGMIVYTKGRALGQDMEFSAQKNGTHPDYPIIVIVNGGSASASEIVAGALQDHKRGVILGTQTFGKGSVQTILPLSDGSAVRLTTSKYYTPSGRSIQAKGIEPDIQVGEDQYAYVKESDLEGHLKGDGEDDEKKDKKAAKKSKKKKSNRHKDDIDLEDEEKKEDVQLDRALEYLKSWLLYESAKKEAS
ncbi:MAG: S41 family peptidase [Thermodesulfobacteriota bacterium]